MVDVNFYAAGGPASGEEVFNIDTATFDHFGFFGPSGRGDRIGIGEAQDFTWIVDDAGNPRGSDLEGSGKMTNNKWIDASGVSISGGARQQLSTVVSSGSGTMQITVSDTGTIELNNVFLQAYDGVSVDANPSGVWVLSYEIITPNMQGTGDTEWALIDATNVNQLVDRSADAGWVNEDSRDFIVGISVRPKLNAVSGLRSIGFWFKADTI